MSKKLEIARATAFYWMQEATLEMVKKGPEGIQEWQRKMDKGLSAGYEMQGAPRNSGVEGFLKYVLERDKMLGLEAGGNVIDEGKFSYWIKDPFLPIIHKLSDYVYEQISTYGYLATKIRYFLPGEWRAKTVKSPKRWNHDRTEWIIEKVG